MSTTVSKVDTSDAKLKAPIYSGAAGIPSILINGIGQRDEKHAYILAKRALDVVASITLLVLALPLFAFVAAVIKLSSRGQIMFRQERVGLNGRRFWCYKFRTMVPDAEAVLKRQPELWKRFTESYKLKDDPRVTPIGKVLRKFSLDEFPQLWNVLKGDMSLIGPRPVVPAEVEKYGMFSGKLLTVKPGCSGMWQAYGRSDTSYDERVELDMIYIDNRSFILDIRLICLTIVAVVARRGAC